MSPSADKEQCPFCLARRRKKGDGTFHAHDWGRAGLKKRCPGTGRTKQQAKAEQLAAKSEGRPPVVLSGPPEKVDAPAEARPEDIF